MKVKNVAVFGFANAVDGDGLYDLVRETAELLAAAGYTVVNGGGPGVMKAATQGAHEGGGRAIGVTLYPKNMKNFEGRDPTNEIDEEIVTGTYVERTLKLIEISDVSLVFNGGTGTLSELGMAWGLAKLHFREHKPVVLVGSFWNEVLEVLKKNLHLRPAALSVISVADSPQAALSAVKSFS